MQLNVLELLSANSTLNRVSKQRGNGQRVFLDIQIPRFDDYDQTLAQQDELGGTQFLTSPNEELYLCFFFFFSLQSTCNSDAPVSTLIFHKYYYHIMLCLFPFRYFYSLSFFICFCHYLH